MIIEYIDKAMHKAEYELIEDGTYFGRIPGFPGVWGNAANLGLPERSPGRPRRLADTQALG